MGTYFDITPMTYSEPVIDHHANLGGKDRRQKRVTLYRAARLMFSCLPVCAYCLEPLSEPLSGGTGLDRPGDATLDRLIPGSRYTLDGIVLACRHCNVTRGNTRLIDWLIRLESGDIAQAHSRLENVAQYVAWVAEFSRVFGRLERASRLE